MLRSPFFTMINYVNNLQDIINKKLIPFIIYSLVHLTLITMHILPLTSTLTYFTLPTNNGIYNCIITAR